MNDLLNECMSDLKTTDQKAFTETFCERCRQTGCERAKWSGDKFGSRVANQADRMLRPEQADPNSSRYEGLKNFVDAFQQAMTMEMADRRGDWNVPTVPDFSNPVSLPSQTKPMPFAMPQDRSLVVADDLDTLDAEIVVQEPPQPALQAPQGEPATVAPVIRADTVQVKTGNTYMPAGGIMLGGPVAPTPAKPTHDPWAVPVGNGQIVKPGAKIKMGG